MSISYVPDPVLSTSHKLIHSDLPNNPNIIPILQMEKLVYKLMM